MISNYGAFSAEKPMEFWGKSTDDKPTVKYKNTAIPNGSVFIEIDTREGFLYDADSHTWLRKS